MTIISELRRWRSGLERWLLAKLKSLQEHAAKAIGL